MGLADNHLSVKEAIIMARFIRIFFLLINSFFLLPSDIDQE